MHRCLTLLALVPTSALAQILTVNPDGSADLASLEDALAAAQDGDTIALYPGDYGRIVLDREMTLTVMGLDEPGTVYVEGIDVMVDGATLGVENVTISQADRGVTVQRGALELDGARILGGGSDGGGYALLATDHAQVVVRNSLVRQVRGDRGAIRVDGGAELTLQTSRVIECTSRDGLILVEDASLNLSFVELADNEVAESGGALAAYGARIFGEQVEVRDNRARLGGGLFIGPDTEAELSDLDMTRNRATESGGHLFMAGGNATLVRSKMTSGMALQGGAVAIAGGQLMARNAAWTHQESAEQGGAVFMNGGTLSMDFGNIYGNPAAIGGGLALDGGDAYLRGVILAKNEAEAIANAGSGEVDFTEGLLWGNEDNDATLGNVNLGDDLVRQDPLFTNPNMHDFVLTTFSPAIDAWVAGEIDSDGTPADMGMYGGSMAWELQDDDADGYVIGRDCNDSDPLVNESMVDLYYDGIDSNCDQRSDNDMDGDGFDAAVYGGVDCDDTDPLANPGMEEMPWDRVDSDCDGFEEPDADGDGFPAYVDCDDTNADIRPNAQETWYDGVDSDCDRGDDYDQDRDGYAAEAYGGDDCDDLEPFVNPSSPEIPDDGIDNDCDGLEVPDLDAGNYDGLDTESGTTEPAPDPDETAATATPRSWSTRTQCSTTGGSAPLSLLASLGLALSAIRRRRGR